MSKSLAGRHIVITGSGGISSATAISAIERGAKVHIIARTQQTIDALCEQAPGLTSTRADLSIDAEVTAAFDVAQEVMGGLDGLVAVAGGSARKFGDGPIDQLTSAALDASVHLNLTTVTCALREFTARRMATPEGWGAAVLTGSVLGRYPATPLFVTHAYAAIKAGIEGLARSSAAHYARHRITVNVVAPGLVRTPMSVRAQQHPEVVAYAKYRQPLAGNDGFLAPEDVAPACLYFLAAKMTTGQVLYVDGGWSVVG